MRSLLLLLALTLPAHADSLCEAYHDYAKGVMQNRQNGVAMPRALTTAQGDEVMEWIVTEAYSKPRFSTEEYRQRAEQDLYRAHSDAYGYEFYIARFAGR